MKSLQELYTNLESSSQVTHRVPNPESPQIQYQMIPLPVLQCPSHPNEDLRVFCHECKKSLCIEHIDLHHGHHLQDLSRLRKEIQELQLPPLVTQAHELAEQSEVKLTANMQEAERKINETCDSGITAIEQFRGELLLKLKASYRQQWGKLKAVRKELEIISEQSHNEPTHLDTLNGEQLAALKTERLTQVERLKLLSRESMQPSAFRVQLPDNMNQSIADICGKASVCIQDIAPPSTQQTAIPTPPKYQKVWDVSNVHSSWGICVVGDTFIVTKSDGPVCIYTHEGKLLKQLGMDIGLRNLTGVAVDAQGYIYVACRMASQQNHGIFKFSSTGDLLKKCTGKGKRPGQFKHPGGINFSPDGNMYVCDCENNRIQVFTTELQPLHNKIIQTGDWPADIAFDNACNMYVVEWRIHRIHVLDKEGRSVRVFGTEGSNPGQLYFPVAVCITPDGLLAVTEEYNHRVSIFSMEGTYLTYFGQKGSGQSELLLPLGIASDGRGLLYVCDVKNDRIQVYSSH